jgi:hypothetical protein
VPTADISILTLVFVKIYFGSWMHMNPFFITVSKIEKYEEKIACIS